MSVLYVKDNQGNITQIRTIRGEKGIDGLGISAAEINENGELVLTYTNGNIVNLGTVAGSDGYTPVKGTDYWTEEDKAEIVKKVTEVSVARNQGAENVGKILVVDTDGNLTLTDMPEGGQTLTAGEGIRIENGIISLALENAEGGSY